MNAKWEFDVLDNPGSRCYEHAPPLKTDDKYDEEWWEKRFNQPLVETWLIYARDPEPAQRLAKDSRPEKSEPEEVAVYISPIAYLRSIWAIIRGAFVHPFSTTLVDLSTGESVEVPPDRRQ